MHHTRQWGHDCGSQVPREGRREEVQATSRGETAQPLHLGGSQSRQAWTDAGGQASEEAEGDVEASGRKGIVISDWD